MSDHTSMDFLGQKRRTRPVRKVQVSTHFDELNLSTADGSSTPEPPGLDDSIVKQINNEIIPDDLVSIPQARQAVYAAKIPSPPSELNTLVPEDFNFPDFKFLDLKENKKEEIIKVDDSFHLPEISEEEEIQEDNNIVEKSKTDEPETEINNESNTEEVKDEIISAEKENADYNIAADVEKDKEKSKTKEEIAAAAIVATTAAAAVVTAADSSFSKDDENIKSEMPIKEDDDINSVFTDAPTNKISDLIKSFEEDKVSAKESEVQNKGIIISGNPELQTLKEETEEYKGEESLPQSSNKIELDSISREENTIVDESKPKIEEQEAKNNYPVAIADVPEAILEENNEPPNKPKTPQNVEEITAPPPLPTNTDHLFSARESLKPTMLPVKPNNGAPDNPKMVPNEKITSEELTRSSQELEKHKLELQKEIDAKKTLESQLQAIISKANAQEEAIRYKNESLDQLHSDFIRINNDLIAVKTEKERLENSLSKAQQELSAASESNAKEYLEKSDQVSELKDKLAEFASIIGQKNKEIDSLQRQLEEAKRANMQTALDEIQQYEKIEDDLLKMVEEEILRMQDTIDEQREYNAKLQMDIESEYAYWKRRLSELEKPTN